MTQYVNRTRGQGGQKRGGNSALNILLFVGGAVVILGIVIWAQKSEKPDLASAHHPEDFETTSTTQTPRPKAMTEEDWKKRGLHPNKATTGTGDEKTTVTVSKPVEPRFIGDSEWKRYHRPDCKYVKFIDESKKVSFASASDAFSQGYIPCKVCKPDLPTVAGNTTKPVGPSDTVKPPLARQVACVAAEVQAGDTA